MGKTIILKDVAFIEDDFDQNLGLQLHPPVPPSLLPISTNTGQVDTLPILHRHVPNEPPTPIDTVDASPHEPPDKDPREDIRHNENTSIEHHEGSLEKCEDIFEEELDRISH